MYKNADKGFDCPPLCPLHCPLNIIIYFFYFLKKCISYIYKKFLILKVGTKGQKISLKLFRRANLTPLNKYRKMVSVCPESGSNPWGCKRTSTFAHCPHFEGQSSGFLNIFLDGKTEFYIVSEAQLARFAHICPDCKQAIEKHPCIMLIVC